MGKASRSLLATALGLALAAAGCVTAPQPLGSNDSGFERPRVGSLAKAPDSTAGFAMVDARTKGSEVSAAVAYQSGKEAGVIYKTAGTLPGEETASSITSKLKQGFEKISESLTPATSVTPTDDPTALRTKAKPGPELYVAFARLHEQSGNLAKAEQQYQQALKLDSDHLDALLAYARFKDRQRQVNSAIELYQRAAKAHPKAAAVFNDMGLCFARVGQNREALSALTRAVELQPDRRLYRNNIATVLVEVDKIDEALSHLTAVHGESVAYYNVGYLLQKKGQPQKAAQLFAEALKRNPSLAEAKIWLGKVRGQTASPPLPASPPQQAAPVLTVRRPLARSVVGTRPEPVVLPSQDASPTKVLPDKTPAVPLPQESLPTIRQLPPVPKTPKKGSISVDDAGSDPPGMPNAAPLPPPLVLPEPFGDQPGKNDSKAEQPRRLPKVDDAPLPDAPLPELDFGPVLRSRPRPLDPKSQPVVHPLPPVEN